MISKNEKSADRSGPHPQPVIGITLGDPGGIGPEVVATALRQARLNPKTRIVLIGPLQIFQHYQISLPKTSAFNDIASKGRIKIGRPHSVNARMALDSLQQAVELIKTAKIHALVTAPVCKESICGLGIKFQGHTEFLAQAFDCPDIEMMFVTDTLKTVIQTRHIPIHQVPRSISSKKILKTIRLTHKALRNDFRIKRPKLAVCGLNPHAGEGGSIGKEEKTIIIPAIKRARYNGYAVSGPFAADTLFAPQIAESFDAIIAMYHDQGLIPVKSLAFDRVVNLTIGLPFIRTSPAHGTAFEIAGKNKARPNSMVAAIKLAERLASQKTFHLHR